MKIIPLTKGKETIVDDEDYPELSKWKWSYCNNGYALRMWNLNEKRLNGTHKQKGMYLHNQILGKHEGHTDHINRNKLDNRKENLRICEPTQNNANRGKARHNTSGFKGIWFRKSDGLWYAQAGRHSERPSAKTPEEAAEKYDELAVKKWGKFALTNRMLGLL